MLRVEEMVFYRNEYTNWIFDGYQMVGLKYIHTSNIVQSEQVIFMYMCIFSNYTHICMYIVTMKTEVMNF